MSFPTLKNTQAFQPGYSNYLYDPNAPSIPGQMSYDGVLSKTALNLGILLVGTLIGWFVPILLFPALVAGLVIGLVIAFKRSTNPALIITYAALEGIVLGAFSLLLENMYSGIVFQAVLGTICVFAVVLALYKARIFRTSPLLNKIFFVALIGYALFALVNFGLVLVGATTGLFGLYSDLGPLGIGLTIVAILLASYSLITDFTFIENGIQNNADEKYEWLAVYSLIATLVWLYIEILRLLALFRQ